MGGGREITGGSVWWWLGRDEAAGCRDRDQAEGGRDEGREIEIMGRANWGSEQRDGETEVRD